MKFYDNKWLQRSLAKLGFYTGNIDGIAGPKTDAAVVAFKKETKLRARPYVGPLTLAALVAAVGKKSLPDLTDKAFIEPPWMQEIGKCFGLHEVRDNKELRAWLKSDGATLGDPAKLPWCGDAAATALRNALPDEVFPAKLKANPYWARNFAEFGDPCSMVYGAVLAFTRSTGGHVGFAIGYDQIHDRFRVRGGNQGDMIKDSWLDARRCLAQRWPTTFPVEYQRALPLMNSAGAVISRNEA